MMLFAFCCLWLALAAIFYYLAVSVSPPVRTVKTFPLTDYDVRAGIVRAERFLATQKGNS